jgi:Fe-S cluster biosynthesis and repair protein YggX
VSICARVFIDIIAFSYTLESTINRKNSFDYHSKKDKRSFKSLISMGRTCTKCKNSIPDNEELGMVAAKYPTCNKCWAEWKEYQVMVMNEMKLDMSMLDHRKLLKKHEKIFVGVLSPEGEVIDYTNEDNRKPDEPTTTN